MKKRENSSNDNCLWSKRAKEKEKTYFKHELHNDILKRNKEISLSYTDLLHYWDKIIKEIKERKKEELLDFYLHIPFCRQKCFGCTYYSVPLEENSDIENYLEYIKNFVYFFKNSFRGVRFMNLYLGGGTPSILSTSQLDRLMHIIFDNFIFFDYGQRTFECNPDSMDEDKVKLVKDFGFNRVSFGVQTFNSALLKLHKREYQNFHQIKKLVGILNQYSLKNINADLLFGLRGQSVEEIISSLKKVMDLQVDEITLYRFNYSPVNQIIENKLDRLARAIYPLLKKTAEKKGYLLKNSNPLDHAFIFHNLNNKISLKLGEETKVPKNKKKYIGYSDLQSYSFSLFGIGPNVRCKVYSKIKYTFFSPNKSSYDKNFFLFSPNRIIAKGEMLDTRYEMLSFVANSFNEHNYFSIAQFKDIFSVDFIDHFSEITNPLLKSGILKIQKGNLVLKNESFYYRRLFLDKLKVKIYEQNI